MKATARDTAFSVLYSCRKSAAWSDVNLKTAIGRNGLDKRDAALASRICYGVLQNMALLDFYIGSFCSRQLEKLEPAVPDILRIGAYQILFMDRIPDTAAVNEAVEMTKKRASSGAAGLVNGVLRSLAGNKDALPAIPGEDRIKYLAVRYSHPEWLAARLTDLLGTAGAEEFLSLDNSPAPVTARVNTLKTDVAGALAALEEDGAEAAEHPWLPGSVIFSDGGDVRALRAFGDGLLFVQDAAATLAVLSAGPEKGMEVLDVCAAPGGKSFACVSLTGGGCRVTARDVNARKAGIIKSGADRLGMSGMIAVETADARERRGEDKGSFDLVLADVPCSGFGIIRKKPDVRYKREEAIAELPQVQLAILNAAADAVAPGGALLYSTCTVLPEENEDVAARFLDKRPDFSAEGFTLPGAIGKVSGGMITLWPQVYGTDGFFICRMKRKKL